MPSSASRSGAEKSCSSSTTSPLQDSCYLLRPNPVAAFPRGRPQLAATVMQRLPALCWLSCKLQEFQRIFAGISRHWAGAIVRPAGARRRSVNFGGRKVNRQPWNREERHLPASGFGRTAGGSLCRCPAIRISLVERGFRVSSFRSDVGWLSRFNQPGIIDSRSCRDAPFYFDPADQNSFNGELLRAMNDESPAAGDRARPGSGCTIRLAEVRRGDAGVISPMPIAPRTERLLV